MTSGAASGQRLEALEGIGPQTAKAIRDRFRTDDAFFAAASRLDVDAIASIEGVSERRAVEWIRQVQGAAASESFLATEAAHRLKDDILDKLLAFASTPGGRNRIRLRALLPDPKRASAALADAMAARDEVESVDRDLVRRNLAAIRPLRDAPARPAERLTVCATNEVREALMERGLHRWLNLAGAHDLRDAQGLVQIVGGDELDTRGLADCIEGTADADEEELAPEIQLAWVRENRSTLLACGALAAHLGRPTVAPAVLAAAETLPAAATTPLFPAAKALLEELRPRLRDALAGTVVRGDEWVQGGRLPGPLQRVLDGFLSAARAEMRRRTGTDVQPFGESLPLALDEEAIKQAQGAAGTRSAAARFSASVRAARTIAAHRKAVEAEVAAWPAFDARFAIGSFALAYGLQSWSTGAILRVEGGAHLDLARDARAARVAYELGAPHPVALLTGANSGGKTTLLEWLAQCLILQRLGLPVPAASATLPWVDELHYVTSRRGLGAGAFESFLRGFLPVADGTARKIVLADELEAMTEPETAARILAWTVERLAAHGSLAVLVTHMPEAIQGHLGTGTDVRMDGIEATGLDEQGRLVVDRRPRLGHRARSTPELIVERLATLPRNPDRALFVALLEHLRGCARPAKGQRPLRTSAAP